MSPATTAIYNLSDLNGEKMGEKNVITKELTDSVLFRMIWI